VDRRSDVGSPQFASEISRVGVHSYRILYHIACSELRGTRNRLDQIGVDNFFNHFLHVRCHHTPTNTRFLEIPS
jgi:hypothetical protein